MRSILLVDDDEDDRSLFKEAVNSCDKEIQCWTANDGQHAQQVLMCVIPDAIFLDLNMPKMNGLEFLSFVKKNKHYKSIPVIIYSTSSNPEDQKKSKELGASDFITKPSDFHDLIARLSSVFQKHFSSAMTETNGSAATHLSNRS